MDNLTLNPTHARRFLLAFILTAFATLLFLFSTSTPAFACPPMTACGDTGGGGGTPPAPGIPPSSGSNPGSGGGGIGGGGTEVPPNVWIKRVMGLGCPARYGDGKAALAKDIYYQTQYTSNTSGRTPPDASWTFYYSTPNGQYFFVRDVYLVEKCLYPPRSTFITVTCSIRYYVEAQMVAPQSRSVGQASAGTGYAEGSYNYAACYNSKGYANLTQPLKEYGFYNVNVWQRAATARVEVFTSPNEVTGVTPAPRIVSLSPAYTTSKRVTSTASIDCQNGFKSPGIMRSDWSETPCQSTTNPSYTCQRQPVLFDGADGTAERMMSFAGNSTQFMRDGKPRKVVFNQTPVGATIKVNSYSTRFAREAGSTPWDSSRPYTKNQFELRKTETGLSILTQGSGTLSSSTGGRLNTVFAVGYSAGMSGAPTKITQELSWAGTRTIQSGTIVSINPNTGGVSYAPRMETIPTSGLCKQTASMEYIRAIGDSVR